MSLDWGELKQAAIFGDLVLLKKGEAEGFPMSSQGCGLLQLSARYGRLDCVEYLAPLSLSDPLGVSCALQWAAEWGQLDCVRFLSTVSDPKNDRSWAFSLALRNGRLDVAEFLYPLSDMDALRQSVMEDIANTIDVGQLAGLDDFIQMMELKKRHIPSAPVQKPRGGL